MNNFKFLVSGVGNINKTRKYYDNWSENYDATLKLWNYQAPKKSIKFLKETTNIKPKNILDLACGTGLFGAELKKIFPNSIIYYSTSQTTTLKDKLNPLVKDIIYEFIEHNKPATFKYPWWSQIGDHHMTWLMLTGKLKKRLNEAGVSGS